ncbi:hypothetical protein ACFL08_04885 [Patescibacteria group bacterium]
MNKDKVRFISCKVVDFVVPIAYGGICDEVSVCSRDFGDLPDEVTKNEDVYSFYFQRRIVTKLLESRGEVQEIKENTTFDVSKRFFIGEEISYGEYREKSGHPGNVMTENKRFLDSHELSFILKNKKGSYCVYNLYGDYECVHPYKLGK